MIWIALLIALAAVLWNLLPELRHVEEIERAYESKGGADSLAGESAPSLGSGVRDA